MNKGNIHSLFSPFSFFVGGKICPLKRGKRGPWYTLAMSSTYAL